MASLSPPITGLQNNYPWVKTPFVVSAPMAFVAKPKLAVAVSKAGGLGFIAAGYSSEKLHGLLDEAAGLLTSSAPLNERNPSILPIGVGFITWSASLESALPALKKHCPSAVWLFAPSTGFHELVVWADKIRQATSQKTKIWVQVSSVADAIDVMDLFSPEVLVVQGSDAGGHSLARGASIVTLVPEIHDRLWNAQSFSSQPVQIVAAGGISDGRGVAAAISLGAHGCAIGTRFLASPESLIPKGYQKEIIRASDGGSTTVRTRIYDHVRDITGWPGPYNGRSLINRTYIEANEGLSDDDNRELYLDELEKGDEGYGPQGRLTTYAGTGVGLVKEVMSAQEIVFALRKQANDILLGYQAFSRL